MAEKTQPSASTRGRGRPAGGGNPPEHARELLLDAAQRSLIERGYRASTMQVIAGEAGYTRAVVYRHFASRDELMDALVVRTASRKMAQLYPRLDPSADLGALLVESLVIVATEIGKDPLLGVIAERNDEGNVADLITRSAALNELLTSAYELAFRVADRGYVREGVRPADAARFVLSVALGLLLRLVPDADDAEQVRRYATVFVLPALLADPPAASAVFTPLDH